MLSSGSSELAEDSANFESVLTASLQAAAQFFLDKAYLFGEGTGKPLGMLDPGNPALVVVNKNANTPSGSIILEDVPAMYAAQAPACRLRAEWIFTDELIPALYQMQVRVSNKANTDYVGGSATPVFVPDGQGGGTLLGRRVNFSEKMRAAGLQGDAAFICFDQYAIGIRLELQLRRSLEAGFKQDQIFWRLTTRVDGQSTWESKMKLQNGNVTSPFVVLQAR
jgi:HK97 family phage major capsid protein